MQTFTAFKQTFDPLFLGFLEEKVLEFPHGAGFDELRNELRNFAMHGKRIRPAVAWLASGIPLNDIATSRYIPFLFAVEFFHLFACIHDDIVDRSDTRYGKPSLHTACGIPHAMLIGDMCLHWAHECVSCAYEPYAAVVFSALAEETITGEILDVSLGGTLPATQELLDLAIELKTARYTFIYPLFLGYAFGSEIMDIERTISFGRMLGHAFQHLDDLADVFWDEEKLGKAPCTDFRSGIPTHLSTHMQLDGTPSERSKCSMLFGNPDADVETIRALALTTGAYEFERGIIEELLQGARETIPHERLMPCVLLLEEKLRTL